MISNEAIDAFNSRLTVTLNSIKTMRPSQLDSVKAQGSNAEALLKNRDLALFVHQFKFELADALTGITGHTEQDNNHRIALSNQLAGIEGFIQSLHRAVHMKNKVVTQQAGPVSTQKEDLNVRTTYQA